MRASPAGGMVASSGSSQPPTPLGGDPECERSDVAIHRPAHPFSMEGALPDPSQIWTDDDRRRVLRFLRTGERAVGTGGSLGSSRPECEGADAAMHHPAHQFSVEAAFPEPAPRGHQLPSEGELSGGRLGGPQPSEDSADSIDGGSRGGPGQAGDEPLGHGGGADPEFSGRALGQTGGGGSEQGGGGESGHWRGAALGHCEGPIAAVAATSRAGRQASVFLAAWLGGSAGVPAGPAAPPTGALDPYVLLVPRGSSGWPRSDAGGCYGVLEADVEVPTRKKWGDIRPQGGRRGRAWRLGPGCGTAGSRRGGWRWRR